MKSWSFEDQRGRVAIRALAHLALIATAAGAGAVACGRAPGTGPAGPAAAAASQVVRRTGADTAPPPSTCQSLTDGSGPFQQFTTSLTRTVDDETITIDVTKNDRWWDPDTNEQNLSVQLNGSPLFQSVVDRYSYTDEIDISQTYYWPYEGASSAFAEVIGGWLYAMVDGRSITPVPATTPPSQIQYDDGQPAPDVTVDPDVQSAMNDLLTSTQTAASNCLASDTTVPDPGVLASPGTAPHQDDTRDNYGCQVCRLGFETAAGSCFYAAGTSIGCGPFVFFCAVAEIASCTAVEIEGLKYVCDRSGGACCAVGCGGEDNSNFFGPPPVGSSVGCCNAGEQCLNRSSWLCCSSGTTPCGGTDCCGSGQSCVSNAKGGQMCCNAGSVGCGEVCCPSGESCASIDGFPLCCQSCNSDADCGTIVGGERSCEQGCCVTIPG